MSDLWREFRQVLAELELCSHGTITRYNPTGAQSTEKPILPPGERFPPHIWFRERWHAASSDEARQTALEAAQRELDHLRKRQAPAAAGESEKDRNARMLRDGEGWSANEIALRFRCGVREVMKIREKAHRDPATGKPWPPVVDPKAEAQRLKDANVPIAQIAKRLDVSVRTVHYWVRPAA